MVTVHTPSLSRSISHSLPRSTWTALASGALTRNVTLRSAWTLGYSAPITFVVAGLPSSAVCPAQRLTASIIKNSARTASPLLSSLELVQLNADGRHFERLGPLVHRHLHNLNFMPAQAGQRAEIVPRHVPDAALAPQVHTLDRE